MFNSFFSITRLLGLHGAVGSWVGTAAVLFSIWMAYDCWKRQRDGYWIWLILFTGGLFALIYFFTQYLEGSRVEQGLWQRIAAAGHLREMDALSKRLGTASSYEVLGDALLDARKYREAETAYREALQRQPDLFDVQVRLGYTLLELGRIDEARPLLGRAYQKQPAYDDGRLVWMLARCQAKRGNTADARNLYEYYLTKHSYSEARIEYAQVLQRAGEGALARIVLEELLKEIEFSPRYARSRERPWARSARRLLSEWKGAAV